MDAGRGKEALSIWQQLGCGALVEPGHLGAAETIYYFTTLIGGMWGPDECEIDAGKWALVREFSPWVMDACGEGALDMFLPPSFLAQRQAVRAGDARGDAVCHAGRTHALADGSLHQPQPALPQPPLSIRDRDVAQFLREHNLVLYVKYLEARVWDKAGAARALSVSPSVSPSVSAAAPLATELAGVYLHLLAAYDFRARAQAAGAQALPHGTEAWRALVDIVPHFEDSQVRGLHGSEQETACSMLNVHKKVRVLVPVTQCIKHCNAATEHASACAPGALAQTLLSSLCSSRLVGVDRCVA